MGDGDQLQLEVLHRVPGRPILAQRCGAIHISQNCSILRSTDQGQHWEHVSALPQSPIRKLANYSRMACRILRQEVRALAQLSDGTYVASDRTGVYYGKGADRAFRPCRIQGGKVPVRPPMRICAGPEDVALWGEYGPYGLGLPVRIFASRDKGESFQIAHTFPVAHAGHVHNIIYDQHREHYWVFVGDLGMQTGIGRLSADLKKFEWLVQGNQVYRTVEPFDSGDHFLYATDTEIETNQLISMNKNSGQYEKLREFEGSCIYACRFGDLFALTTSVEPSNTNTSQWMSLWLSRDGETWKRALRARKDRWSPRYFQFGSLVLPSGESSDETVFVGGQAAQGLDGITLVARLQSGELA
jgi:hypothetical protein